MRDNDYGGSSNIMITQPKHNMSVDRATDLLNDGLPLIDCYIDGEIKIETDETWNKEVIIENCIIEYLSGNVTQFDKPVKLINSHFKKCQFMFTYFLGGLTVNNCTFDNYLNFEAGGHNKKNKPITIINNDFLGFVNFFDCWYENEVTICNNNFQRGTNLLGKPHNIPVTFDIEPINKDNIGQLNLDAEGDETN